MANVRLQTQTQTQERGILFFNVVAAASHKTSFDIYGYIRVQFLFSHFCILFLSFFLSFFLYTRQSTTHHIDLQWTERRIAYASMLFLCTHTCTSRTFTWNASYTYNVWCRTQRQMLFCCCCDCRLLRTYTTFVAVTKQRTRISYSVYTTVCCLYFHRVNRYTVYS